MYINPFVAGVLFTIGIELVAMVIAAIYKGYKDDRDK